MWLLGRKKLRTTLLKDNIGLCDIGVFGDERREIGSEERVNSGKSNHICGKPCGVRVGRKHCSVFYVLGNLLVLLPHSTCSRSHDYSEVVGSGTGTCSFVPWLCAGLEGWGEQVR